MTTGDQFEWDESKRLSNLDKHGLDFLDAKELWEEFVVESVSSQDHGEQRWVATGLVQGRCITVVYTHGAAERGA